MVNIVKELFWRSEPKKVVKEKAEEQINTRIKTRSKKGSKFNRKKISSENKLKEVEEDAE